MSVRTLVVLVLCALTPTGYAQMQTPPGNTPAVERVQWDKTPIAVTLRVGVERRVTFPTRVKMGPPRQLLEHMTTIESLDDTLYLEAHTPFEATRMLVRECTLDANGTCTLSGATYIVTLRAATDDGSATPIEVFPNASPDAQDTLESSDTAPEVTPTDLVRYAAQQLFSPTRLLENNPNIHRVPLERTPTTALYRGGALEAHPQVAFSDGTHWVTAVLFKNLNSTAYPLDPRFIRGRWLSRTLITGHTHLAAAGDARARDAAAVFLLSPRPFEETFQWQP